MGKTIKKMKTSGKKPKPGNNNNALKKGKAFQLGKKEDEGKL